MTRRDNKGYTLVEMVVVIAIVAILAAMATISVTLIHSAKAKEAAITFDNDIATLVTRSKNQDIPETEKANGYKYHAIKITSDASGYYYIDKVLCKDPSDPASCIPDFTSLNKVSDPTFYSDLSNPYDISKLTDQEKSQIATSLSKHVDITYNGSSISTTGVIIVYNKAGLCIAGEGEYQFLKDNGNQVARVEIRKNGSHQSR